MSPGNLDRRQDSKQRKRSPGMPAVLKVSHLEAGLRRILNLERFSR